MDRDALAAFADEQLPRLLEEHHTAGAVVSFVLDGRVVFTKGYGYRDVERRLPVDPERTLFRVGSVSKLFVWTAVMQQVERGALELDADVNHYLADFQIPATFPQPITLRHLMAHTPGFEDQVLGMAAPDALHVRTLDEVVRQVPKRVAPPGALVSYSNYGACLAAYLVERVSGLPFDRYVDDNILRPLGMTHTTFAQPVPAPLGADLSAAYVNRRGRFERQGFEFLSGLYPAGALSTTASDLSRFLLAHLGDGTFEGASILSPATAQRMHEKSFALAPGFSGAAHGFVTEETPAGPLLYHGGDTIFFHSIAGLLPERRFGFFVSSNTASAELLPYEFGARLLDRFFPATPGRVLAARYANPAPPERFAGLYLSQRRSESDMTRVLMLFIRVRVEAAPGGALSVTSFIHPRPELYLQVGDDLFQQADGSARILFLERAGKVTSLVLGRAPVITFTRPALVDRPGFNLGLALACGGLLLLGLVLPPTGVLSLRRRFRPHGEAAIASAAGLGVVVTYVAFFTVLAVALQGGLLQMAAPSLGKQVAPFIPWVGAALTVVAAAFSIRAWRRGFWSPVWRVGYSALCIAATGLFALLMHWRAVAFAAWL